MKAKKPLFTKKDLKVSPWDASEFLDTDERIRRYLEVCLEDECGPSGFLRALGEAAKAIGMTELARRAGVTRGSLYKSFDGNCRPEFETVWKIARAMGVGLSLKTVQLETGAKPAKPSKNAKRKPAKVEADPVKRIRRNGNGNEKKAKQTA